MTHMYNKQLIEYINHFEPAEGYSLLVSQRESMVLDGDSEWYSIKIEEAIYTMVETFAMHI